MISGSNHPNIHTPFFNRINNAGQTVSRTNQKNRAIYMQCVDIGRHLFQQIGASFLAHFVIIGMTRTIIDEPF